ncbi:hypothetical protein FOXYSP1_14389 [Fusarium oxysporum f. sp. phaseoli]
MSIWCGAVKVDIPRGPFIVLAEPSMLVMHDQRGNQDSYGICSRLPSSTNVVRS